MDNVASVLLGAGLVAVGVLAAALADRIRGLRVAREPAFGERVSREKMAGHTWVVGSAELLHGVPAKPSRALPQERKVAANTGGGDEVIAALLAAGYKKPIATEATWSCSTTERATVESWAAAALRRLARGGRS